MPDKRPAEVTVDASGNTGGTVRATPPKVEHEREAVVAATASAESRTAPADAVATSVLVAIEQELSELESLIQLQERKLQALTKIRHKAMSDGGLHQVEATKARGDINAAITRKIEALEAEAFETTTARAATFEEFFVDKAVMRVGSAIVDVKMGKLRQHELLELIVLAEANGRLTFYVSPTTKLLELDTHKAGLHSIALDLDSDNPYVAVLRQDAATVDFYGIKLLHDGRVIWETAPAPSDGAKSKKHQQLSAVFPHLDLQVEHLRTVQLAGSPHVMFTTSASRRSVLGVADRTGGIQFFATNGTVLREIPMEADVQAVATVRHLLAFSNGTDVVVLPLSRNKEMDAHVCPGSTASVHAIAFDVPSNHIVYSGTSSGDVIIHLVEGLLPGPRNVCRILSRVMASRSGSPITRLEVSKTGHLIAASASEISVFIITGSGPGTRLEALTAKKMAAGDESATFASQMAWSDGSTLASLGWTQPTDNGGSELVLTQSLLPAKVTPGDPFPMHYLFMAVIVISVVIVQVMLRRKSKADVDPWELSGNGKGARDRNHFSSSSQGSANNHLREKFGPAYDSLSEDLKRKIAEARQGNVDHDFDT